MSVEEYGRRLLDEIEEERLDQFLTELGSYTAPSRNFLNVPCFDNLLRIFLPEPSRLQANDEHDATSGQPAQSVAQALRRSPVVELIGTSTCTGKTQLLYYITAVAILPQTLNDCTLDGKDGAVVVLDTDDRFDVRRLRQVMKRIVIEKITKDVSIPGDEASNYWDWLDKTLDGLLLHVHIFKPQSSASLVETLKALPEHLLSSASHFSSGRALSTILLDSISAFYWQDRRAEDASESRETSAFNRTYREIVAQLRSLQQRFRCAVVATNWGLIPHHTRDVRPRRPSFKPHLPPAWSSYCTLRLIVDRRRPQKFPPLHSVEEALREVDRQREVGATAEFIAWVDQGWGTDTWTENQRVQLREVDGRGQMYFEVTASGVAFKD